MKYDRGTYSGFVDWFFEESFSSSGGIGRMDFLILIVTIHLTLAGLSITLGALFPPLLIIFFLAGSYCLCINGFKRVRDIKISSNVGGGLALVLLICAFIPVVWQILLIGLVFFPKNSI